MKNIDQVINEALKGANSKNPASIREAANLILAEDVSSGDHVVSVDDKGIGGYAGIKGKVVGGSDKGSGFVDVEFESGVKVPLERSLLIKV